METNKNIQAFMPVHPGSVLKAELEERGLSQKEFAQQIGMRPSHLSELINGKTRFTMAFADKLQDVLGIDSQSWINLQTQYDYSCKAKMQSEQAKVSILEVSVEDPSLLSDIKRAISLLKGVGRVSLL